MQEILDIFLEKSKQHHSNIIYAQIYKNDLLKEEFRLFPVKTRLNIWSLSLIHIEMCIRDRFRSVQPVRFLPEEAALPVKAVL